MANYIEPIGKLINCFSKLPGVGNKTAGRYAYHIINMTKEEAEEFAQGILDVKNKVSFCSVCGNYTDVDPCVNCQNNKSDIVVVVAEPKDVSVIEKVKNFQVSYHVLHGTISPLSGRGPDDIRINELLSKKITDEALMHGYKIMNLPIEEAKKLHDETTASLSPLRKRHYKFEDQLKALEQIETFFPRKTNELQ